MKNNITKYNYEYMEYGKYIMQYLTTDILELRIYHQTSSRKDKIDQKTSQTK